MHLGSLIKQTLFVRAFILPPLTQPIKTVFSGVSWHSSAWIADYVRDVECVLQHVAAHCWGYSWQTLHFSEVYHCTARRLHSSPHVQPPTNQSECLLSFQYICVHFKLMCLAYFARFVPLSSPLYRRSHVSLCLGKSANHFEARMSTICSKSLDCVCCIPARSSMDPRCACLHALVN